MFPYCMQLTEHTKFPPVSAYLKSGITIRLQYLTITRCEETTNDRFPRNFLIIHSHHSCHAIGFLVPTISNYHQWFPNTFLNWYPIYAYKRSIVSFTDFSAFALNESRLTLKFPKYNTFESSKSSSVVLHVFRAKMVNGQDQLTMLQCLLDAEIYTQTLTFPDYIHITCCKSNRVWISKYILHNYLYNRLLLIWSDVSENKSDVMSGNQKSITITWLTLTKRGFLTTAMRIKR